MNTRTLQSPHKQIKLCALVQDNKLDVIVVQEHRTVHDDQLQYENLIEGFQLITSSAWRNSMGAAVGGVGVLLSNFARKVLVSVCYISPRILKVTLNGNPQTTIIVTYSPTNAADEDDVTDFYNQLTKATREVPAHNFLIVIGYFNARVGHDIAKFSYHETTNRNGELMLDYTLENNLVVTNTIFQKRATKLWTCELPTNKETAAKLLPRVQKKTNQNALCYDVRVEKARHHLKEAHVIENDKTSCYAFEQSKRTLDDAYEEANSDYLEKKLNDFEEANLSYKHRMPWDLVNEISGRKKSRNGRLKGDAKEDRIQSWFNHFQELLGEPPVVTDEDEDIPTIFGELPIRTNPFDKEEYQKAKEAIKEGKSFGKDGIPPEVIKRCNLDEIILDFCNKAFVSNEKPDQWSIMNLIHVPKSGDLSNTANYRGISLSSIVAKTYNRMLLERIRPHMDSKLRPNQCGFRENRSTVCQILALRRIIEGIQDKNLTAVMTFIDFKKAFDTIHRGEMVKILKAYGLPTIIVKAIEDTYQNTRAKVVTSDGETEEFNILAGVLQGDTLAPYLFT
ncbi:uncharacterized protein [Amphiura filiformis]|uniref:uncharacterized protein n=1 Tax=Amphiura filiformis TaxID=82378 RepID=UPI003B21540D